MKKRMACLALALALLTGCMATGSAENMGVQVIGGPALETEPVSLDDLKLNTDVEIDNWGIINATAFEIQDSLGSYEAGYHKADSGGWTYFEYYQSGIEADFIVLYMDILNTALIDKDYLSDVAVKVVYDDVYEYGGWAYQRNYDNSSSTNSSLYSEADKGKQNIRFAIAKTDQFPISPMYEGHYLFGCTLPNAIIESKKPLKMIITIDGNEITYNIRK